MPLEEGGGGHDGDITEAAESEEIFVSAYNAIGACGHGAGQEWIICSIPAYHEDLFPDLDDFAKRQYVVFDEGGDFLNRQRKFRIGEDLSELVEGFARKNRNEYAGFPTFNDPSQLS